MFKLKDLIKALLKLVKIISSNIKKDKIKNFYRNMSKSTPLKRKKTSKNLRPTLYISSDSDDESPQKIYHPKSLNLSEKRRKNIPIQERTDEIEAYYLIQFLGKQSEYGIVSDKSIILDDENTQIGTVKHYSKSYPRQFGFYPITLNKN
ncbi:hypothetical protein BpHYR1_013013 [Brachionus plicatilis]|uniref:Uncharacterized protein n=1 Tax=Brachionus plicatilis TaxID=10195 RepID=A0A3M7R214_BRAPC|nr:hypothetical protein BpHYR1_013013 [Brachionus plicatilis]